MSVIGLSDKGKVRKTNQDMFALREFAGVTLIAVFDGMGGAQAGEVASEIACVTFVEHVEYAVKERGTTEDDLRELLDAAVFRAGEAVYDSAESDPERHGMGTTIVAAAVTDGGIAVVANVGDSRAYHLSGDGIRRVTRDHSVVEEMIERGEITQEEARTHPRRNLITRVLGAYRGENPDLFSVELNDGDGLLLCSDGLSGVVLDKEILDIISEAKSAEDACKKLLRLALRRGAPDNVTMAFYLKDNGRAD